MWHIWREINAYGVVVGRLKVGKHLEDGRLILKCTLKKEGMDWIKLAEDSDSL
jgi:hypothetical protein